MAILGRRVLYFGAICLMIFVARGAYAQFGGSISGVVEDPSGAVVPGETDTSQYRDERAANCN